MQHDERRVSSDPPFVVCDDRDDAGPVQAGGQR